MAVRDPVEYPWYQAVQGPNFTQGDIFKSCPIPIPTPDQAFLEAAEGKEKLTADIDIAAASLIVMSQACDIEHEKVETIVLCPVWPFKEVSDHFLRSTDGKEALRKGNLPAYHLLNKDEDLGVEYMMVDFHRLYTLPKSFVRLVAERGGERARLLPPYREHLSQAFARYFMRVGLPIDIPKFG